MTIDELSEQISKISSEKSIQNLFLLLTKWKDNKETVKELKDKIERYIDDLCDNEYKKIYPIWLSFVDEVLSNIDAMTINERLHCFGLSELFDKCTNQEERLRFYRKLHAKS